MNVQRRILLTFAAVGLSWSLSAAAAPQPMSWTVDGVEREGLVFAPSLGGGGIRAKMPLVFAFHGHGGTMRSAAVTMGLQRAWPEAVVVYLQGLPTVSKVDPEGRRPGWQHAPGELGDRDLKLVDAVLASMRAAFPIDDRRIYATGFSNGAFFSYLLWATRANTFAAFAPVAGLAPEPPARLTEPRPLLQIAGEEDKLVKLAAVLQTVATVRQVNGCTAAGEACGAGCTRYPSTKGAPVVTLVHGGGHVYPPFAAAKTVEFFKAHELAQ
ncbi:MAG TPA: esterase [Thermoanaerobaculia bacterium]|nr:esterase [Thermoanaerobaculia bacterium]